VEGKSEMEEEKNENVSGSERMVLQLVQKNAKLKKKLTAKRKMGETKPFCFVYFFLFCLELVL